MFLEGCYYNLISLFFAGRAKIKTANKEKKLFYVRECKTVFVLRKKEPPEAFICSHRTGEDSKLRLSCNEKNAKSTSKEVVRSPKSERKVCDLILSFYDFKISLKAIDKKKQKTVN